MTQHRYLYCKDNPVNRKDPTGERSMGELVATSYQVGSLAAKPVITLEGFLNAVKIIAAIGSSVWIGAWTLEKVIEWERTSRDELAIRLQHYTTAESVVPIIQSGYINSPNGTNYFTPDYYCTTEEATEKLATPSKREFYFSLNMYMVSDGLSPITRVPPRFGHDGGGWQTYTEMPIPIHGDRRKTIGPIPLSDDLW